MIFGNYLKQIRESKNITLHELSDKCSISAAQLSRIETGARGVPKPSTIKKISEGLNYSYPELMKVAGYQLDEEMREDVRRVLIKLSTLTEEEIKETNLFIDFILSKRSK